MFLSFQVQKHHPENYHLLENIDIICQSDIVQNMSDILIINYQKMTQNVVHE